MSEQTYEEDFTSQAASYGLTEQAMGVDRPNSRFLGDANLHVQFFMKPRHNEDKSAQAGRPIFEDTEYVEIRIPGDKDNIVIRPARDVDRGRFRPIYTQFKSGQTQQAEGTPLEQWPQVTRSQVEELKFFGVFTVEQLVNMPDSSAQNFMGAQQLRASAKHFLEASEGIAVSAALEKQLTERDNEVAAMQNTIAELSAQMAKMQEAQSEQKEEEAPGPKGRKKPTV